MSSKRHPYHFLVQPLLLLVCVGVFSVAIQQVFAGALPSALSPNTSIKAAIYQGVVAIAPTTATVLELGNAGRDIAGSSDLYIRPNGLTETVGAHIVASGTVSDLYVSSLCLYGTGSEVCQSGVPTGGSDTFWRTVVQSGSFEHLVPTTASQGVQIGSQSAPVLGKALEINTNAVAPALSVTGTMMTGSISDLDRTSIGSGSVSIAGRLLITSGTVTRDTIRVGYRYDTDNFAPVWSQAYQGRYTGLDADTFDGTTPVLFTTASKKDFFWKDIIASPTQKFQVLCVHTEATSLCSETSGVLAGKICTLSSECGSGTCVKLCRTQNATCPAGTGVINSHTIAAANCATVTGDGGCNDYCSTGSPQVVCDGSIAPPATSCPSLNTGDRVYSTSGTFVSCGILGIRANITCNCKVTVDTPYLQNAGYGGGDLCTDIL